MARAAQKRKSSARAGTGARRKAHEPAAAVLPLRRRIRRWIMRALAAYAAVMVALIVLFRFVNPPTTPYMLSERLRLGQLNHEWRPLDRIAPVAARSVVAAEDANFCRHWGFDIAAIRAAAEAGATRGGSTIDQQVVKNVFLWQGHNWFRKALEAIWTPVVEVVWPKRRILEVYLNVAEFATGTFGIEAAAQHYYLKDAEGLNARQAALLAAVLPDPKGLDAARPGRYLLRRATQIEDGARTIAADGRAQCFQH